MSDNSIFNINSLPDGSVSHDHSLKLTLPKFSKNYDRSDFLTAIVPVIGRNKIECIGRARFPNEWFLKVHSADCQYKLLKKGCVTVKGRKCVISPYEDLQVCGKVHWMPTDISDNSILDILKTFGTVSFFEQEKIVMNSEIINTAVRFFVMNLKEGVSKDDIPHFITISKVEGLVTIKGREPMCFGCKGVGHRKVQCPERKMIPKPKGKKKKKAKSVEPTEQTGASNEASQTAEVAEEPSRSARGKQTQQQGASSEVTAVSRAFGPSAVSSLSSRGPEGLSCVVNEVNNLQEIVNSFSKRLNDALHTVAETAKEPEASEPTSAAVAAGKKKKKKKKKPKKSDNYDVTTAASDNLTQPTVNNENSASNVSIAAAAVGESSSAVSSVNNAGQTSSNPVSSSTSKNSKKKKKNGAGLASAQPKH